MDNFATRYSGAIDRAKAGDERSIYFLRLRLKHTADNMPVSLLIQLSEQILKYRKDETQQN